MFFVMLDRFRALAAFLEKRYLVPPILEVAIVIAKMLGAYADKAVKQPSVLRNQTCVDTVLHIFFD